MQVTGDFDKWSATISMQKTEEGHFVKVVDLPANSKVYYKFVVDGHWCVDGEAQKEGEGAHENNYVLTGAPQPAVLGNDATLEDGLPVLGHGAAYVTPPEHDSSATAGKPAVVTDDFTSEIKTNVGVAKEVQTNQPSLIGIGGSSNDTFATPVVASATSTISASTPANVTKSHYDDSGPSPSDPQAVRSARDNPISEAYTNAVSQLPSSEEIKHEVEHVAEIAGGFLAAGLAAGAAALGLSNATTHTESAPITGHTSEKNEASSSSVLASKILPSDTKGVVSNTQTTAAAAESKIPQTSTLEQTAVAAATSAATNAYNASGLSGLTGVGAPVSSLSKDGTVGFTGVGTAVNQKTGVIGTSKIVQGIHDANPTEDTQTARLAHDTAGDLLRNHEDGAKVERIGEHAVLAEVGLGGAAIGTAVVTDDTISSASALAVPAQAAEHLQSSAASAPSAVVPAATTLATERAVPAVSSSGQDTGLAPALQHNVVTSSTTKTAATVPQTTLVQEISSAKSVPAVESSRDTPVTASKTTGATVTTSQGVPAETATKAPVTSATAATKKPVTSAPTTAASSPAKASVMRQTLRSEPAAKTPAANPEPATAEGKKKKGLLRRMKSMFGNKQ